jgi:hypothetical protein
MAMGEAVGVAAYLALNGGTTVRNVDARRIQKLVREQGGDPGDIPSANAKVLEKAA